MKLLPVMNDICFLNQIGKWNCGSI